MHLKARKQAARLERLFPTSGQAGRQLPIIDFHCRPINLKCKFAPVPGAGCRLPWGQRIMERARPLRQFGAQRSFFALRCHTGRSVPSRRRSAGVWQKWRPATGLRIGHLAPHDTLCANHDLRQPRQASA